LLARRHASNGRQRAKGKPTKADKGGAVERPLQLVPPWRRRWLWSVLIASLLAAAGAAWWLHRAPSVQAPVGQTLNLLSQAELLAGHSTDWRLARLKENPAVMVIEFPSLTAQGMAMNRLAALLEKAGAPRDRVLDDFELALLIARSGDNAETFYQGHDYTDSGLALFYTLAQAQALPLNVSELRLQRELISAEVLAESGVAVLAKPDTGTQALITFTAIQPDNPVTPIDETIDSVRRAAVLSHEASHGRFFTRPVYREHCIRLWREVLTEPQREHIRMYLASIGYDRNNESLMLNEAQAFMMNTADTRAFSAASIGMTEAELARLRTHFWQTLPPESDVQAQSIHSPAMNITTK
jgi:hypothetical protein